MKRAVSGALAGAAVCLALSGTAGCSGRGKEDPGLVRVATPSWMFRDFSAALDAMKRDFQDRHEGVRVRYDKFTEPPPQYLLQFRQQRTEQDVILAGGLGSDLFSVMKIRAAEDLGQAVAPEVWGRLIGPAQAAAGRFGAYRGVLPYLGEVMVLNYNRVLLREAGIEGPARTFEELERQAEIIRQRLPTKLPVGVRTYNHASVYWLTPLLLALKGTAHGDDELPLTDGPEVEQALVMLKRWVDKGYANKVDSRPDDMFRSGDAVYYICWASHGSWARRVLGDDVIAVAPLPGKTLISFHGGTVPVFAADPGLAVRWMVDELLSDTMQQAIYTSGKMGVLRKDYEQGNLPGWMFPLREAMENGYVGGLSRFNIYELELAMNDAIQGIVTGQFTPKEAMALMARVKEEVRRKAAESAREDAALAPPAG